MPALFRLYLTFPWAALGVVGAMLLQLAFALGFPIGARVVVDTAIGGGDQRVLRAVGAAAQACRQGGRAREGERAILYVRSETS